MAISQSEIDEVIDTYPKEERYSLAILQDLQRRFGYIPKEAFPLVGKHLGMKTAQLYAMATFYKALSLKPKGKHVIKVCDGTACHLRGSPTLLDALKRLDLTPGETTPDGEFSLETVNCLGACAIAPVMVVDDTYFPKVKPDNVGEIITKYKVDYYDK
jgi:NADH-quinone oxidoreductase subunit E